MSIALLIIEDLELHRLIVIYPSDRPYPLAERVPVQQIRVLSDKKQLVELLEE